MKKFRFRNFQVYKDALEFRKHSKALVNKFFPKSERFLLTDQTLRALNSIILEIAEGSDRSTDKDFANFLNRSHTSLNEVVSCFDIALMEGYISENSHLEIISKAENLANQLTAFRKKLISDSQKVSEVNGQMSNVKCQRSKVKVQRFKQNGFTLIELLMGMTIFVFLLAGVLALQQLLMQGEEFGVSTAFTIESAQNSLQNLVQELRNARQADNGAYPLQLADDQEIIFFSNADNDADIERIRYFLDGTDLKKGAIEPQGFPVQYPTQNEVIKTIANYVQNASNPIFFYYNQNWPADTVNNPLSTPAQLSNVSLVKIEVRINAEPDHPEREYVLEPFVQIRMLKGNL